MSKLFKLDIVTPIKTFSFDSVSYVKCPGVDGYFGIMKNHTNSIINLTDGTISVKTDKNEVKFSCSYGIADINSDSSDAVSYTHLTLPTNREGHNYSYNQSCLLYTSPSPRDLSTSRMPSSA